MFDKTWETIVEPENQIPLSNLELKITEGDAFTLGQKRPALYAEVLQYWDKKQIEMTMARAKTLAAALMQDDRVIVERMQKQIGGVEPKHGLSRAVLDGNKLYLAMNSVNFMDFAGTNIRAIEDEDTKIFNNKTLFKFKITKLYRPVLVLLNNGVDIQCQ